MKIFLDTNFIIDWLFREEYKVSCERLLEIGNLKGYKFAVSFLSLANIAYIARKQPKEILNRCLTQVCKLFEIVPNNMTQVLESIKLDPPDFEDGLQYVSAIDAECDYIISRNCKDFTFSKIPVMPASEFLEKLGK